MTFYILVFLAVTVNLYSQQTNVGTELIQIVHFPVTTAEAGSNIPIKATIDGEGQAKICYIYFRAAGQTSFEHNEMLANIDGWTGEIPATVVKEPGVEYFISAITRSQSVVTMPAANPYNAPYKITIESRGTPAKRSLGRATRGALTTPESADFLILSPEAGETVAPTEAVIAISFIGNSKEINWKSFRLYVNGKNITKKLSTNQGVFSFIPKKLPPGEYQVLVKYKKSGSNEFSQLTWTFQVDAGSDAEAEGATNPIYGNVYVDLKHETVSKYKLETNVVGGNLHAKYAGFNVNGNFYLTSREEEISQPRNRYFIGVESKWIGFHFGDTYPRMHELMLWGKRVRGFGAYLHTGLLNVDFVTGESNRAVKGVTFSDFVLNPATGDTLYYNPTIFPPDTVNDGNATEYAAKPAHFDYVRAMSVSQYGTYQQIVTGIRPSFGRGENFQLGFSLLKGKDQINSIEAGYNPKDNVVVGSDVLLAFDNHRFEIKGSVAFSLITSDISKGMFTKAQIDSTFEVEIPFDPAEFEKYLIINETTMPLDPRGLNSLAYQARMKMHYFNNSLEVQYKSIGPDFNSLGNSFMRKDIRGYSISDRLRLLRNRFIINFEISRFEDNFLDPDQAATILQTLNAGFSIYLPQPFPQLSVNWRDHSRDNGLREIPLEDEYDQRINNDTRDLSVNLSYNLNALDLNHILSISYISSERTDGFDRTIYNIDTNLKMASINTKFQIPLTTTFSFATNENIAGGNASQYKYQMVDMRAEYRLLDEHLRCFGGIKHTSATNTAPGITLDFRRLYFQTGAAYELNEHHSASLNGYFINYFENGGKNYMDQVLQLRYDFRF
jgi:hypothetical protein